MKREDVFENIILNTLKLLLRSPSEKITNPSNKTNFKKPKSQNPNHQTKKNQKKPHKRQPEIQSIFNSMVNYDFSILDSQRNLLIIYEEKVCKSPVLWNASSPERKLSSAKNINRLWKLLVKKRVKGHLQINLHRETSSDSHIQML